MKRRNSITPTKVILAIIATGAVYKVGTLVTEPPKGPPAPPKTAPPTASQAIAARPMSQAEMVREAADRMKAQQTQMRIAQQKLDLERKLNDGKDLPKDDGISPEYFKHVSMGKTGFDQNAMREAKIKRITDEVNKQMAPIVAKNKPQPMALQPPSAAPSGHPSVTP